MDPRRFDTLARAFAAEGTRRRLVAALATLPFVGALAHGVDEAEAEKPRDRIKRRKDANRRLYSLNPAPLAEIDAWLEPYRRFWANRLDALETYLDKEFPQ